MKLFVLRFFVAIFLVGDASTLKEGTTCLFDSNCDDGLHCKTCLATGNIRARCTRMRPVIPTTKVLGQSFDRYSWLTTHNSFATLGANSATGATLIAPQNQQDSITSQLKNGVRGLMLDMYDFENDVWLCHSFGGKCFDYMAFQPAVNYLKEIKAFLESNPSEVITIIIEDYVTAPNGLTKVFDAAGLRPFWFPVSRMPKEGEDWPVIDDMIKQNQRLVVFTSKSDKEATEGIAFQWKYMVENQYGDGGMKAGSCPNRAESLPMNTKIRSLVLMNYFPDAPDITQTCKYNSDPLIDMVNTCHAVADNRWPNFIAVDYYMMSEGGGSPAAVDMANGGLICRCRSISDCKENTTSGECSTVTPDSGSPALMSAVTSNAAIVQMRSIKLLWSVGVLFLAITLL